MVVPAPLAHGQAHRHLLQNGCAVLAHPGHALLGGHGAVILRGVEHRVPHEFAVLQHLPAALGGVVVPIHHQGLIRGVHRVVVEEPAHGQAAASQLARKLRIHPQQLLVAHKLRGEEVLRILNVPHSRLPEQVQQVHPADGNISQPAQLTRVPEHAVGGAAAFELVPPGVGIGAFELILLEYHRQDPCQLSGLLAVALLPGEHRGLRVAVHGVGVLGQDAVHQPAAGGLGVGGVTSLSVFLHLLPVAQLPELLVVDDAALQVRLALLVLFQDLRRPAHLLRADLGL